MVGAHDLDAPAAADDRLLQGLGARRERRDRLHGHAVGQGGVNSAGELGQVEIAMVRAGEQIDVEVLAVALVASGEGKPEAEPGSGREALGVGDGQACPTQASLPDAGDVAVRGEPHLAVLREANAPLHHAPTPTGLRDRSVTGTSPPRSRSWPVPWLPPAGGVAEATTCSKA